MGLFQSAVETYDNLYRFKPDGKSLCAPVAHSLAKPDVFIKLNMDGSLSSIEPAKADAGKIIIPVTEGSAGRAGLVVSPHPLCDQLGYMIEQNKEKYEAYIAQLEDWSQSEYSHPALLPILTYVKNGTILQDLQSAGIVRINAKGMPENEKLFVCWRLCDLKANNDNFEPWNDKELLEKYTAYYLKKKQESSEGLCMVTGNVVPLADQHLKGVVSLFGNAKLISANDQVGYTFRGRFLSAQEAATIGYESSQKAHNALRGIIEKEGVQFGKRTFVSWSPLGTVVCKASSPMSSRKIEYRNPAEYGKDLFLILNGYKSSFPQNDRIIVAAFDAATTGRLALTYYQELFGTVYLDRLYEWDSTCSWMDGKNYHSPSLQSMVECAFGIERNEKGKEKLVVDEKVLGQQMQRMIICRVEGSRIPLDIVRLLVQKASFPQAYSYWTWRRIVYTACAALNRHEHEKGEDVMSWELQKEDRSFQFGRLLAAMERVENDFYAKTDDGRQTNAIKSMSEFRQRPWSTYERVNRHLCQAYIPRIEPWQRKRYEILKDEIVGIIRLFPEAELNKPLSDIYLMGYDLQHAEFYKTRKEDKEEKNNEHTEK